MRRVKKIFKWLLYVVAFLVILLLCGFGYIVYVSRTDPPHIADTRSLGWQRADHGDSFYTIGNSWFRKSRSGLYEMYTEGQPFERGVVNGKLSKELVTSQEDYFNAQINKMIPSKAYLHFLKYVIGWFNRDLDKNENLIEKKIGNQIRIFFINISAFNNIIIPFIKIKI